MVCETVGRILQGLTSPELQGTGVGANKLMCKAKAVNMQVASYYPVPKPVKLSKGIERRTQSDGLTVRIGPFLNFHVRAEKV